MNYELAKQLKDAGFPQLDRREIYVRNDVTGERSWVAFPTLEELIEACGKHLSILRPYQDTWQANNSNSEDADFCSGEGSTPTIAVAKLWLALNPAQIIN